MASALSDRAVRVVIAVVVLLGGGLLAQAAGSSAPTGVTATAIAAASPAPTTSAVIEPSASTAKLALLASTPRVVPFNDLVDLPSPGPVAIVAKVPVALSVPPDPKGTLSIVFYAESDGATEPLRVDAGRGSGHARLFIDEFALKELGTDSADLIPASPGSIVVLPLRLGLAPGAPVTRANGVIRVTLSGGADSEPQSVEVAVSGSVPGVRFAPETVAVQVTRWLGALCGSCLWHDASVDVIGEGTSALVAGGSRAAFLSNGVNGEVTAILDFEIRGRNRHVGIINVKSATGVGKYDGKIPLSPRAADATALPVSVQVQDAFYIPLILLFAASFLGGFAVLRLNLRRRHTALRKSLEDAVDRYRKQSPGPRGMYRLDPPLGIDAFTIPGEKDTADRNTALVQAVYVDIGKARSDEEFAARSAEVTAIVARIDEWVSIAKQVGTLREAMEISPLVRGDMPLEDARDLIDEAGVQPDQKPPEKTSPAYGIVERMSDQERALRTYVLLRRAWNDLTPEQKAAVPKASPDSAYIPLAARKTHTDSFALLVGLAQALGDVRRAARLRRLRAQEEHGDAMGVEQVSGLVDLLVSNRLRDDVRYFGFVPQVPPGLVSLAPQPQGDGNESRGIEPPRRSAAQAISAIKRWDWAVAAATAVAATVAFLLPRYASHVFGTWQDYATLVTLGFLGAAATGGLVLSWELFPGMRSYTFESVLKPEPKPGAPAAVPAPAPAPGPAPDPKAASKSK